MKEQSASDLHLSTGNAPMLRIHGDLVRIDAPPLESDDLKALVYEIAPETKIKTFEETGDVDFGYEYPGFARQTLPAVSVNASSLTQANLTLHVGSVSQTVTVAAASDLLAIEGASAYHGAITPAPASVFEAVTATGEHWTSPDGLIWTLK